MRRATFGALAAACIAIALLFIRPPGEPGVFMRDFEAYWSAGRAALVHADAYSPALSIAERSVPGVSATREELLPFVGAPPTLPLWMLFARLPYAKAASAWSVVLAVACAILIFAALRACRARMFSPDAILALLCAFSFVPITSAFVLGQPALVGYAAAAIAVLASQRSIALTALAAIAGAVQPNVALSAIVCATTRRGFVALALAVAIIYAVGAIVAGFAWPIHYAALLGAHGAAERYDAIQYTPASIAFGFGAGPMVADAVGAIVTVATILFAIYAIVRAKSVVQRFTIAACALPIAGGFTHEHDLVLAFIPALWAMRRVDSRWQPFALLGFGLAAVNWMDFAQEPQAVWQDLLLAAGALLAALAWCERRTPQLFLAASLTYAVTLCGALIGVHHPAPIWPNDMTPFAVARDASAAQIWHLEQVHTGLEKIEPAWALLRSLALAGSLMLLWIVSNAPVRYRHP